MENISSKYARLKDFLRSKKNAAVAFSGGVDSSVLLKASVDVLGDSAAALTVDSETFSRGDLLESKNIARRIGARQIVVELDELADERFAKNSPDRCYWCKKNLFSTLLEVAKQNGFDNVLEATNASESNEYRPGISACRELGIQSPFLELGFEKSEIRALAEKLGLPNSSRPSNACFSSRIAYGEKITPEKISMVSEAEGFLKQNGLEQVRVRLHGNVARIEVPKKDFEKFFSMSHESVVDFFKKQGFVYVTFDLEGYRAGSMSEELKWKKF